jgi:hypothetical protein
MRSNLPFILSRIPANLAESGTDVTLHWTTLAGGTLDPVTGATVGATPTAQTEAAKAFLHFVQIAQSGQRIFNEFEVGDCIADFAPTVTFEGREQLWFEIDGQRWVAKQFSDKLGRTWDVVMQGQRLFRSVLLRKAT